MPLTLKSLSEFALGVSWEIEEATMRTSHAILAADRVWLIDPVDQPEAMERVAALGEPAGVIQLLDRHNRDCARIAGRLGVPHLAVPSDVPGSPFRTISVLRLPTWRESALWWPEQRVLVVAEAIGTGPVFTTGHGAAGMHPILRPFPPSALRGFEPEHLLCGHGAPVHGAAARGAVVWAYAHARRDLVRLPLALARLARGAGQG
jgi:hypothetical protein